ncbi:hypothetical protein [Paraburkholderia sp. CI3]|uniref:hypothetical protein n=1 Tax=Paraburkholderia sp. CI3 TaxID=2991060 RepID=UPI003D210943
MEQQKQDETGGKEECQLCRITYSIYSNFPPMPSAIALNAETGEWFPFDRLRSYSNGHEMAEALGYAWACDCRGRSPDSAQKKGPLSIHRATPRSALPQSSICLECMIHAAGQGAMTLER